MNMKFYIFFLFCIDILRCDKVEKSSSKLLQLNINRKDLKVIEHIEDAHGLDIFSRRCLKNGKCMITCKAWPDTIQALNDSNIHYEIEINTIHSLTIQEEFPPITDLPNNTITFTEFLTLDQIYFYLNSLPQKSTKTKKLIVESIGKSIENRDILMLHVIHPNSKFAIFIDAGIHAREWLTHMMAIYLIIQLVKDDDEDSTLRNFDWFLVPCLNPDGYVYSHTPHNRFQRKNMNNKICPSNCMSCGVDLNRNFGYKFGVTGSSGNPCAETYRGEKPFSEPESRALRDALQKRAGKIILYIALHTWGPSFIYPWSYARKNCHDWYDLDVAARVAASAIRKHSHNKTQFTAGTTGSDFYPAAGSAEDYAKYLGIKYSYTLELQGGGSSGFNPPSNSIKEYIEDDYEGILAMCNYILYSQNYNSYIKGDVERFGFKTLLHYLIRILFFMVDKHWLKVI